MHARLTGLPVSNRSYQVIRACVAREQTEK
jgi:hypothetical protein